MYEELVKRLREEGEYADLVAYMHGIRSISPKDDAAKIASSWKELFEKAADAIEELSREIDIDNAAMTAMDAAMPRWIPVTETPPRKVGDDGYNGYLIYGIYDGNGYYEVADYTTDKFDNVPCFHVDGEYEPDVTHYMPLPEPPKEET